MPKRRNENEGRGARGVRARGGGHSRAPPRRGNPGVFFTCEAGRERKCAREALDLLHHYYYATRRRGEGEVCGDTATDDSGAAKATASVTAEAEVGVVKVDNSASGGPREERRLGLEEELALLRKGATADEVLIRGGGSDDAEQLRGRGGVASMRSPFAEYDTGIRGIVCIVCTLSGSAMIPYDDIVAEARAVAKAAEAEEKKGKEGETTDIQKDQSVKQQRPDNENETGTEKAGDSGVREGGTSVKSCSSGGGKIENVGESGGSDRDTASASGEGKGEGLTPWDPVDTVHRILRDIRSADRDYRGGNGDGPDENEIGSGKTGSLQSGTNGASSSLDPPPGSRFITRALPMQVTCFASIEEIKMVAKSLLERFLVPKVDTDSGDCKSDNSEPGKTNSGGGEGAKGELISGAEKKKTATTFKIDFKRRNCSNVTRDGVIDAVAPLVYDMGKQGDGSSSPSFAVKLTDPDYTIRVEVCRTLCGISILPQRDWHGNFNLATLRDATAP